MTSVTKAITTLKQGKLVAYPTEAVYGLGCDPFNESATQQLLELKKRDVAKGLILIAAQWIQIQDLIGPLPDEIVKNLQASWPGPTTWLVPATKKVPVWIRGNHESVALRITSHPVAKALCSAWNGPLVSTSANVSDQQPAITNQQVQDYFGNDIETIVAGELGSLSKPTQILDAITGKRIR